MSSLVSEKTSGFYSMDKALDLEQAASKKKRNLPGTPDPHAEVISLSPRTLMATNRFFCEVCGKGFQRDQNLQLHRRGHNLPWKLKQRDGQEFKKRVYVCPEVSCVHHNPSRALGDLTGIKKHFFRKHGDKKWKCEKCSKRYAVQSDWKAHLKVCGTREYHCDCGKLFSRRDSFITHRAFCNALAEETAKISTFNPIEASLQSIEPDGNGTAVIVSRTFEVSTSPFTAQFTNSGFDMDPPMREVSRLMTRSGVGRVDSEALDYNRKINSRRLNEDPALSLSLGTGLGPGPPDALQMLKVVDGTFVTRNEGGVSGEETTRWAGMVASMLKLPKGSSETWSRFASMNCDSERWHGHRIGHQVSTSKESIAMIVDNSFRLLSWTGSAQLPATALLQKVAMMGTTGSIPSSFHSYSGDSRVLAENEARQNSLLGVTGSLSSSFNSLLSRERQSTSCNSSTNSAEGFGVQQVKGSLYPEMFGEQGGSIQEMLNSCSGGPALSPSKVDYTRPSSKNNESISTQEDIAHHYVMGSSDILLGRSIYQDGFTLSGLSGAHQNDGAKKTLDFLGVGHSGGRAGMTRGMAQTLFTESANFTTVSAGQKVTSHP